MVILASDFIDFIEEEDRIDGPRLGHSLNDATRHGPDVGSPMAANLSFVGNPAKSGFEKLPPEGTGNRFRKRGLTATGRAVEAKDRGFKIARHLLDGKILDDSLFDLF